jgi:hypothetical protein
LNSCHRTKDDHGLDVVGDFKQLYYDPEISCEDYVEDEGYVFTLLLKIIEERRNMDHPQSNS